MRPFAPLCFAAPLALLAAGACEHGTGSRRPAALADLDPGTRTGAAFATLDSVRVRVVDASGAPVYRAEVAWTVASGGGAVSPAASRTDAAGIASAAWTLGGRLDTLQVLRASVDGVSAEIRAQASVPAGTTIAKISGDAQSAPIDTHLPQPLVVEVRTAGGQPLQGVTVRWYPQNGSATLVGGVDSTTTDANGRVAAQWQTGCCDGRITAVLQPPNNGVSTDFTVTATPGPPAGLVIQWAGNGNQLVDSVVVAAVDRYGNLVPGATVDWTAVDGSVSPAQSVADARGYARTSWTHATFGGPQYLLAGVPGGTPVTITGRYGNPNIGVRIELPIRPDEDHPTFLRFGDSLRVEATSSAAASATAYFNGASAPLALVSGRWRGGIPATQANGLDTITVWVRNAAGTDSARDVRPFLLQRALRVHLSQPLSLTGEPYYPFPGGAPGPTYNAPSAQVRIVADCLDDGLGWCQRLQVIATRVSSTLQDPVTLADVAGTHLDQVVDFSAYAAQWGKTFWVRVVAPGADTFGIPPWSGYQQFQLVLP